VFTLVALPLFRDWVLLFFTRDCVLPCLLFGLAVLLATDLFVELVLEAFATRPLFVDVRLVLLTLLEVRCALCLLLTDAFR